MTGSKRALAVFAASALFAPLVSMGSAAQAAGEDTPPPTRDISQFCEGVGDDPFTDVPEDFRFNDDIECIFAAEITRGLAGGRQYGPTLSVPRDQMASFIARLIDKANELEEEGQELRDLPAFDGTNEFIDVAPGNTHREAINRLEDAGIVQGGPGGRPSNVYGPDLEVTRAQMASFIIRALEFMTGEDYSVDGERPDFFTDDENAVPHEPNINGIARLAIATGDGRDSFNPLQSVSRGQMAAFLARSLAFLNAEGFITPLLDSQEPAPEQPGVTVENQTVAAGEPIRFTIEGDNIDSVTVSGDCVETTTFDNDNDTTESGFQVEIDVVEGFSGECTVNVDFTDEDGNEFSDSFDVTVEEAPSQSATERPELVSASIVSTTTPAQASTTNPAGTVVSFTFDESIQNVGDLAPRIVEFMLYDNEGNRFEADQLVSVEGNTVTVRFTDAALTNPSTVATITLATVDFNAVTDADGDTNPEGDAPLGTQGGGSTNLAAGITDAPDLVSVSGFRQTATPGQVAVDFTFDEAATLVGGATADDFRLIRTDNTELVGQAISTSTTQSGGQNVPGGNGTTTITVIFGTQGGTSPTADQIARGTVEAGTVQETTDNESNGLDQNVLQAADVSNGGNTIAPDLVSIELRPNASSTANDQALFVFDQNVSTADFTQFFLFKDNGDIEVASAAVVNGSDRRQVLVTFDVDATDRAIGGFVNDNAVFSTTTPQLGNQQDEVGVPNSTTTQGQTPGRTDDPDLTAVELFRVTTTDPFGNQTQSDFRARYTFDEAVTTTVNPGDFFLYLADGTRLVATACQTGSTTSGAEQNNNTVVCTAFSAAGGTAANSDTVGSATLGTVDDGAVLAVNDGGTNPEGAEFTSGGTGTRTA